MNARRDGAGLTIALCFAVAVLEGFDIQAIGVAAPRLGAELGLNSATLGMALSASNIGLVLGASIGGWLADRWGRKPVLIGAVLAFGVFTLGTMRANVYELLFAARLGAGFGFGAALPNIMAMATEVSAPEKRGTTATMMFCGMPVGGGTVALISWLTPAQDWRQLFLLGGLSPVLLAPALFFLLRETRSARAASTEAEPPMWHWLALLPLYAVSYVVLKYASTLPGAASLGGITAWLAILPMAVIAYMVVHSDVLFGARRAVPSLLLWVVFLPTLLMLYLILNWLPTLVVAKGFPKDASQASVWFNVGSIAGALICGRLVDRFGVRWPITLAYAGLIGVLVALAQAATLPIILLLSGAAGFLLIGAQFALYGAAASYYPTVMRGRGSGAAIAWGRLGSVAGPLAGGYLLAGGATAGGVVLALAPAAVVAGVAVFALSFAGTPAAD
jgi:AAHS family 3-hydroxyphenylpropionic acid transporter